MMIITFGNTKNTVSDSKNIKHAITDTVRRKLINYLLPAVNKYNIIMSNVYVIII